MAVKRRIVWMTDEEWASLRDRAEAQGQTISAYIRSLGSPTVNPQAVTMTRRIMREVVEDDPMRAVNEIAADRLHQRPELRPAPKPSQRKD